MVFEYMESRKTKYEAQTLEMFDAKAREHNDEILLVWTYTPVNPERKGEIDYCLIFETENVRWERGLNRKFLDILNIGRMKEENFLEDLAVDFAEYWRKKGYQALPQKHQYLDREPKHVIEEDEDIEILFDLIAQRKA